MQADRQHTTAAVEHLFNSRKSSPTAAAAVLPQSVLTRCSSPFEHSLYLRLCLECTLLGAIDLRCALVQHPESQTKQTTDVCETLEVARQHTQQLPSLTQRTAHTSGSL